MNSSTTRSCSWFLCLCGDCPGVPRVMRVKQVPLRDSLVEMTPGQYMQYRAALQAKAWAA